MQPLNPALYEALQRRFGKVRIIHPGERRVVTCVPDPVRRGNVVNRTVKYGEQYSLNCPFCRDTKHRLHVGYEFATFDEHRGKFRNFPMHCFNENCEKNVTLRNLLLDMVAVPLSSRARQPLPPPATTQLDDAPVEQQPVIIPDDLVSLTYLTVTHPAIEYLQSRGFDPQEIASIWQVCYCFLASNCWPMVRHRIVVPVWSPPSAFSAPSHASACELRGWQARAIDDAARDEPKYVTMAGMKKSKLLYGLPQALQTIGPVCIVEGVTDVWRVGPGAVALFGKSLSDFQKALLIHNFIGRPLVVLLDRDARDEALEIQRRLQLARGLSPGDRRVVVAEIPEGRTDPGDSTREELFVTTAAALSQNSFQSAHGSRG